VRAWKALSKAGPNGLFMAVFALGWWGIQGGEAASWQGAVEDVGWSPEKILIGTATMRFEANCFINIKVKCTDQSSANTNAAWGMMVD
jgi:hypothetical protein